MKKLLDSDWLRAAQFNCDSNAKDLTPVPVTTKICEVIISSKKPGEP